MDRRASSAKTSLIILHLAHAHRKQEQRKGWAGRRKDKREYKFSRDSAGGWTVAMKKKKTERKMKKKGQREEEERDKERDTR